MSAFGMPIFGSPAIPRIAAGRFGPTFGLRPTPAGFPGASVSGGFGAGLDDLSKVLGGVTGEIKERIRTEAAAGAEEAVKPMVTRAIIVAGVAGALSLVALMVALRRKG